MKTLSVMTPAQPIEHQELGFAEIRDFFQRNWKIILGTTAIVTLGTVAMTFMVTPRYSATSELLLETSRQNPLGTDALISNTILNSTEVESQLAILKSQSLLRRVAQEMKLANDPEFGKPGESTWFGRVYWDARALIGSPKPDNRDQLGNAVNALGQAIDVSRAGLSNVIEITVSSNQPAKAKALADALAAAYLDDQVEARTDEARRASEWLNERQKVLQAQVSASEAEVERFRIDHNLLGTRSGSLTEQQLSELNSALIQARAETAAKRSSYELVEKLLTNGGDVQSIPDILRSGLVSDLRVRLASLIPKEADLRSRYGERHPEVVKARAERTELEQQIKAELTRAVGNLKNDLDAAQSREASLAQSLTTVSNQSGLDNQVTVQLRDLERIAAANKQIYESFLSRARIAEEETKLPTTEARVISAAPLPKIPDFPRRKLFTALSAIMGIGLGTGLAILRELSRPGFMAQRQVQDSLGLPVLATVPRVSEWEKSNSASPARLFTDLMQKVPLRYTEAIRSLRFGIDVASATSGSRSRVVQITSTMPGEGKTMLAISLARSSAAAGELALLIDGDLRLQTASRLFNKRNALGLVDVLTSAIDPLDAIYYDEQSGVHILPAGARAQNPPALLDSERMQKLIVYAQSTFDKVIIDSPPIAIAVDAAAISRSVESIVFAVKWSETPREAVAQAIRQLPDPNQVKGIALTMVDERKLPRHGRHLSLDGKVVEKYGHNGAGYLTLTTDSNSANFNKHVS